MKNRIKKRMPIACIMGIGMGMGIVSLPARANQGAASLSYFNIKRSIADTAIPYYLPGHPFTYAPKPIILPYSLGGRKYSANIALSVWERF